jgi:nicotinamidase-related amidase
VRSGLSAFSSPRFRDWAAAADEEQILFLGLGSCATWLATTLGAHDLGVHPALVEDAIGVSALGAMPAEAARRTMFSVTAPYADWTAATALVDRTLAAHRPRAANQP